MTIKSQWNLDFLIWDAGNQLTKAGNLEVRVSALERQVQTTERRNKEHQLRVDRWQQKLELEMARRSSSIETVIERLRRSIGSY